MKRNERIQARVQRILDKRSCVKEKRKFDSDLVFLSFFFRVLELGVSCVQFGPFSTEEYILKEAGVDG